MIATTNGRATQPAPDRWHPYHDFDERGKAFVAFEVARKVPAGISYRQPGRKGRPGRNGIMGLKSFPPYRIIDLLAADPADGRPVLVFQHEADADEANRRGALATVVLERWAGEQAEAFKGRPVVFVCREDGGFEREQAEGAARFLVGAAASVKVVVDPGFKRGYSVAELADLMADLDPLEMFRLLAESTPEFDPTAGDDGGDDDEAEGDDDPPPRRTEIIITTREHEVIDQAAAGLERDPNVFVRGNTLATIHRTPTRKKVIRPAGSPRVAPLLGPRLRELLTVHVAFLKEGHTRDGGTRLVDAHPPDWLTAALLVRGVYPGLRPLEAIVEAPTLRPDGSILDAPGWDEATGLYYEPNGKFPAIPSRPTKDDAVAAAAELLALVADFPFKDDNHRAVWLAGLLGPFARFAFDAPCPLIAIDANAPGTGKSLLTDIIAHVATGRGMPRTAYSDDDDEMRKRITSIALAGDRLMLLDNIASTFGGAALDSALTATTWRDRILGRSEMTPELPLFTCWYATGNNFALRGDAMRRVDPCRLETTEERPEERRGFKIPNLLAHVRAVRPRLAAAVLTILRGHAEAGRPDGGLTPFGSYEDWSAVVRAAVYWVTDCDPCATRDELRANDPESQARAAFIHGWAELEGNARGLSVAQAIQLVKDEPAHYETLRGVLLEWSRGGDLPGARSVGMRLNAMRGRVVDGLAFEKVPDTKIQRWRVAPVGTSGTIGTNPSTPRESSSDNCPTNSGATGRNQSRQSRQSRRDEGREVGTL